VFGICYGEQLIAHLMGGAVTPGDRGEFGLATLHPNGLPSAVLAGINGPQQVWMSHRDLVSAAPPGFIVTASTSTCPTAIIENAQKAIFGVQFHPEVVHTRPGVQVLTNFVRTVCGCQNDWDPSQRIEQIKEQIRLRAEGRKVFFFVSGGVDSTVAFSLCLEALGSDRVRGVYVDTGLMRAGETEFVQETLAGLGVVKVEYCAEEFLSALEQVREPEVKRHIIGEQFVAVQNRVIEQWGLLSGKWILGQGTIYPDTIESGGTAQAATIKTHHNRVPGIQKLIDAGMIVEPLADYYKDEVRAIGRELGLASALLNRHPFPGPGLAIRCLCADSDEPLTRVPDGYLVPIHSVGVQGDSRSYAPVLAIDTFPSATNRLQDEATELVNRTTGINRVIARVTTREGLEHQKVFASALTHGRIDLLRTADEIVRSISSESGFDREVWQFPVILLPLGSGEARESVVLRPIQSTDGMTADAVVMPDELLHRIAARLLTVPDIAGVYYDLTHKPPGTIEWE
jgi:GMP synthase (glutamine-hydrolysing)